MPVRCIKGFGVGDCHFVTKCPKPLQRNGFGGDNRFFELSPSVIGVIEPNFARPRKGAIQCSPPAPASPAARAGHSPNTTLSFFSFLFFHQSTRQQENKMTLHKLGFRRKKDPVLEFFRPPGEPKKPPLPIKADVDYPNHDERTPQAPSYAGMWLDHFRNYGNIHNPLGSPMESGA